MKINGKNKNGHHLNTNGSNTDQLSKKAVEVLEEVPVKNFNPAQTWLKISAKLSNMDKRFVTWGLAMAASFSLLVAAHLNSFEWIESPIEPKKLTEKSIEIKQTPAMSTTERVLVTELKPLTAKPIAVSHSSLGQNRPAKSKLKTDHILKYGSDLNTEIRPFANPFVSPFAKANIQNSGLSPEIGIDFKLAENYTARRREIYKLGVSSQFDFISDESGHQAVRPHIFVNLEYTTLNKKTNKGWTARSGYLLNPDGQLFQDTTIKVSLFRNIGKHLKLGPEIIFTDNFKKSYPAISLVLG